MASLRCLCASFLISSLTRSLAVVHVPLCASFPMFMSRMQLPRKCSSGGKIGFDSWATLNSTRNNYGAINSLAYYANWVSIHNRLIQHWLWLLTHIRILCVIFTHIYAYYFRVRGAIYCCRTNHLARNKRCLVHVLAVHWAFSQLKLSLVWLPRRFLHSAALLLFVAIFKPRRLHNMVWKTDVRWKQIYEVLGHIYVHRFGFKGHIRALTCG